MNDPPQSSANSDYSIPISAINQYLYCPRRAGLILNELVYYHNHHTIRGKQIHERVDKPGIHTINQANILRSLPVFSKKLKIHGRCDIVEKHKNNQLVPIEYKKGGINTFKNDDAQLCAQALCLEETLDLHIPYGFIYHAQSKRRKKVTFNKNLRQLTEDAIAAIHVLVEQTNVPKAVLSPKCSGCSMNSTCLPQITSSWNHKKKNIFMPRELKKSS